MTTEARNKPKYQEIADRLKSQIITENLRPGDRMPTEDELMETYQASRSSIREALRFLQATGTVSIRPRRGVVVREPKLRDLMTQLAFGLHFSEQATERLRDARFVLEMGALPLAARRASARDFERLEDLLRRMEEAWLAGPLFRRLDREFHRTLLQMAGNDLVQELATVLDDFFALPVSQRPASAAENEMFTQEHRRIKEALELGDISEAQRVLDGHLGRYYDL